MSKKINKIKFITKIVINILLIYSIVGYAAIFFLIILHFIVNLDI
jgi:hypothetical protein